MFWLEDLLLMPKMILQIEKCNEKYQAPKMVLAKQFLERTQEELNMKYCVFSLVNACVCMHLHGQKQ